MQIIILTQIYGFICNLGLFFSLRINTRKFLNFIVRFSLKSMHKFCLLCIIHCTFPWIQLLLNSLSKSSLNRTFAQKLRLLLWSFLLSCTTFLRSTIKRGCFKRYTILYLFSPLQGNKVWKCATKTHTWIPLLDCGIIYPVVGRPPMRCVW